MKPYFETPNGQLYCGDCLEIMPTLEPVDLVLTDPPYNFTTASSGCGKLNPWADICNSAYWFAEIIKQEMFLCQKNSGAVWQFCNWRTLPIITKAVFDSGYQIESLLVWDKCWIGPGGTRGLRPSYELVALICHKDFALKDRGLYDIQRFKWSSHKPNGHPAEKPESLFKWIIDKSDGQIIVDPFLGSGTTAVAAERLNRKWIGIEISEQYCEIAAKRIERETAQMKLFV